MIAGPALKPRTRAPRVHGGRRPEMLAKVEQHIYERIPHLTRRREWPRVISRAPDRAPPVSRPVDGACRAPGQPLHPAAEALARRRLDDEVQVVRLHRKVQHAKAWQLRARNRHEQRRESRQGSKRRQAGVRSEGDVNRMPWVERRSRRVRDFAPLPRGLASGTPPAAAPGPRGRKRQLSLRAPCHLESAVFSTHMCEWLRIRVRSFARAVAS